MIQLYIYIYLQLTYPKSSQNIESYFYPPASYFHFQSYLYYSPSHSTPEFKRKNTLENLSQKSYLNWNGHNNQSLVFTEHLYQTNQITIQTPSLSSLIIEHLFAPLFLFQIICLIFWSYDDYVLYSIFMFGTLIYLEGILIYKRLDHYNKLEMLIQPPKMVFVYRNVYIIIL